MVFRYRMSPIFTLFVGAVLGSSVKTYFQSHYCPQHHHPLSNIIYITYLKHLIHRPKRYVICNSLYCKQTSGNDSLLLTENQLFKGIYNFLPRIDGSAPLCNCV